MRLFREALPSHSTKWSAIKSIAGKIGCSPETLGDSVPGDRARSCGTCRNRRSQVAKEAERERSTTGTGGAFAWQDPN